MAKISEYFHDYEVGRSYEAQRRGINNDPPPDVMERASMLAVDVLDVIRFHHKAYSPSSWYRCEELEKALTWDSGFLKWCRQTWHIHNDRSWPAYFATKSHPRGEGADIEIMGVPNDDLMAWILRNIPVYDQVIREFPVPGKPMSGWVHVAKRAENNRMMSFTIG